MSNIDIRRFVDINIIHDTTTVINSTRDTVVLLTGEGSEGNSNTFNNLSELAEKLDTETYPLTISYATFYFNNGGAKLKVIEGITDTKLADTINNLNESEIIVAYTGDFAKIKEVAIARENNSNIYGVYQKILLGRVTTGDTSKIKNLAVKYSTVTGAEMTIGAYLSTINVNKADSVKDYSFTKENITAETNDDSVLKTVIDNNMNVDMFLAGNVMNLGGNLKNGLDIVNEYVLIILQQTVTERLLNVLTEKLAGSKGVSKIKTTIIAELNRYTQCGYLSTDKVWNEEDKNIIYNGKTYTVIEKGTPLLLGYEIFIVPLNDLSEEDKALHKAPPVYLILADKYGIRAVTVNGEVI